MIPIGVSVLKIKVNPIRLTAAFEITAFAGENINLYKGNLFMSNQVKETTDATFEQDVLNAEGLVLVDFWAPWCNPCKAIAPILDAVAATRSQVTFYKLNVDDNPDIAAKFEVQGIPTLLLYMGGKQIDKHVGALSKAHLESLIDSHLN